MADLNTEIKIGADASGVEAGVTKAKRSLKDLGAAAQQAGKDAGAGMASVGAGGDQAAKKVDSATRSMQNSLQRLIAEQKAGGKASREYYEALADTKGISRGAIKPLLDQLDAAKAKTLSAESAAKSWKSSITSIGPAIAAAFSVAAITGVVGKVVAVQREFDILNSSLKTVTGSSAAAERELAWLKTFAKETPFGLSQATQGFVKMKALGLDPTRAALTSFGNTASAMGKDLNQMIEAVADASTGEFERLKEFGIKAKKQGDDVSLTFQGVTKTIGNSAKEITKYLQDIGDNQFAGAMEERAKTLDGTIAALGDSWDELFRTVSTNNVGTLIFDSVTLANGAIEDATTILKAMGGAASDAGKGTGALATIQGGLATVFETVAVLGANVKYVLTQVGNEVGGLAAQVAQAAQFNFSGVAAIRAQMVADAKSARSEIDATTERILNARKEQERFASYATRNASAATDPRRLDVGGSTAGVKGLKATAKAVKAAVTEYDKLIKKLGEDIPKAAADAEAAQMGYNKAQTEFLALARSPEWAKFTSGQRANVAALFATKIASEQAGDAITSLAKAQKEFEASRQKEIGSHLKEIEALGEKAQKLEDEVEYYGMSKEAIESLTTARMLDQIEVLRGMDNSAEEIARIEETIAARKRLAAAGTAKDSKVAAEKYADDMLKEQKKAAEESGKYWEDALMRAFESGKGFFQSLWDTIKNTLKTQVLKVSIQGIMGSLGLGAAGAAQAGTGLLGSALSSATGGYISSAAGGLTIAGSSISAIGSSVLTGLQAGWSGASVVGAQAAYTAAGASGVAGGLGIGSSIGSALAAIPGWGWAAIGAAAVLGLRSSFVSTQSTGYASRKYGSDGSLLSSATDGNGIGEAGRVLDGIYKSIAGVQASLGATGGASITYNSNTGRESKDPQFYLRTGSYDSGEIQKNDANVSLAISRTILTAIQDSDLPKYLEGAFDGMVAGSMSQEQITAAITGGQALKAFNDELLALPFANLADLSFAATQSLIGFSGGLDQLKGNLASYYENFYTSEEKTAQLTLNTGKAFESLGLTMPALDEGARAAYRSMVELAAGQDMSVDANAKAYAGLLALNPAMNQLAPAIDNVATSVSDAIAKMNAAVQSAQNVAVQMGITTAYAVAQSTAQAAYDTAIKAAPGLAGFSERQIVAYAADPTKRGELDAKTFGVIDNLVTAIGAWNAAQTAERGSVGASSGTYTTDTSYTPDTSAADAARLLNDQLAMQARLFELTGDKAAAAAILEQQHVIALASLDPSLRGFQSQIWDLEASALNAASSVAALKSSLDIKTGAASDALSGVKSAVDAQRKIAQVSVSVAQESVSALNSVFDLLKSNVNDLYGSVDSTKQLQAAQGSAFITQALATAKASGYLPDSKDLADAISKSRSGIDATVYASQQEADFARLVMAGELAQLQDISGDQLTIAEKALAYAKDQITALDDILGTAQAQLDATNGINTSVLSVSAALTAFGASLTALMNERITQGLPTGAGGFSGLPSTAGSYDTTQSGGVEGQWVRDLYSEYAGKDASQIDAQGYAYWVDQAKTIGLIQAKDRFEASAKSVRGYAIGTNYVPNDGIAYLHEGEAVVPRAYNPAAGGTNNSNARLESLVEGLTAEVQRLQAIVNDGNRQATRTADATNGRPESPMLVETV